MGLLTNLGVVQPRLSPCTCKTYILGHNITPILISATTLFLQNLIQSKGSVYYHPSGRPESPNMSVRGLNPTINQFEWLRCLKYSVASYAVPLDDTLRSKSKASRIVATRPDVPLWRRCAVSIRSQIICLMCRHTALRLNACK